MAKIQYGFGVSSVCGKLSNIIHTGGRYGPVVKRHTYSNPKPTPLQTEQRNIFNRCVQAWRTLTVEARALWELYSEFYNSMASSTLKTKLDGYHVFCEINGNILQVSNTMILIPVWTSVVYAPVYGNLVMNTTDMYLDIGTPPSIVDEIPVIRCTPPLPPSVMTDQNKLSFVQYDGYEETQMFFTVGYLDRYGSIPPIGTKIFVKFYFVNTTTGFKSGAFFGSKIIET